MKRLLMVLLLGLMLIVLVACGSQSPSGNNTAPTGNEQTAPAEDSAKTEYDRACDLFDQGKFYSAKVAFENSGYEDWEQRAAECIQSMPEDGELWHNEALVSDEMGLILTVDSEEDGIGRYFAVYTEQRELAETIFIKGPGSVETWLLGGNYYIKDASGTEWYGTDELFGPYGSYETMVFNEIDGDRYLTVLDAGYSWEITVNTSSSEGQSVGAEEGSWEDWG